MNPVVIYRLADGLVFAWGFLADIPEWADPQLYGVDPLPDPWPYHDTPMPYRHSDGSYHPDPEA